MLPYNQPLEEWEDDLNNNEIEQVIPQSCKGCIASWVLGGTSLHNWNCTFTMDTKMSFKT